MVEIKIGVLARKCLDRRIDSFARLVAETAAWEKRPNAETRPRQMDVYNRKGPRQNDSGLYKTRSQIRPSATSQNLRVEY